MKIRAIILLIMIAWDASCHWTTLLGFGDTYWLMPQFPLLGVVSYDLFWTIFWTAAFLLMLTLVGSQVVVKTTTHVHNYPKEKGMTNEEINAREHGEIGNN